MEEEDEGEWEKEQEKEPQGCQRMANFNEAIQD